MTDRFNKFFNALIKNEGEYSDDKADSGGKTLYGISQNNFPSQFAQVVALWKQDKVRALAFAEDFYFANFYKTIYELIHDEKIAFKVFDLGVNMGMVKAIKILQDSLGITNDGIFGQNTLDVVNCRDCYQSYLNEAEKYYRRIVYQNPEKTKFLKGWLARLRRTI
jgi:lysozyme family protein